jgi:hypothetical protein
MGEITDRVSVLEESLNQFSGDLAEIRMVLRDQVGTGLGTTVSYAKEAARQLAAFREGADLDQVYERTLKSIDKMLKDAFPGDIATIEGRVAAACANTKAMRAAQTRIEATERANQTLSDELDRERRAHAEVNKKHLATQKDVDHYRDLMIAQRERADAAESEVEKLRKQRPEDNRRDYWRRLAEDMKAELEAAEEKLRRKSHETPVASSYEEAAERMREIRKIADDRGSFWVQGIRYVPAVSPGSCEVKLAEAQRKLDQIQEALEQ